MRCLRWLALVLVLSPTAAWAVQPDEILPDSRLESRARALSSELRCLVCQNQSIDDSAAPLARDLRFLVRERLKAGDSDSAVKAYLVARYGDFVLLKPPLKPETAALWMAPPLVLLAGLTAIILGRRKVRPPQDELLDPAEQARLDALIGSG